MKTKIGAKMKLLFIPALLFALSTNCSKQSTDQGQSPVTPPPVTPSAKNEVDFYLTTSDGSHKLEKQDDILAFGNTYNSYSNIEVNSAETFQTVDGFGFTLTGGSAEVINSLNPK